MGTFSRHKVDKCMGVMMSVRMKQTYIIANGDSHHVAFSQMDTYNSQLAAWLVDDRRGYRAPLMRLHHQRGANRIFHQRTRAR